MIYIIIDVFSHLITGVYVGFEGPSWIGAMEALSVAVLDKVSYCSRFGIPILPEGVAQRWDASTAVGRPRRDGGTHG